MNDILIKQFMNSVETNRFRAGLIQSAFYMGYFLLATSAHWSCASIVTRPGGHRVVVSHGDCLPG